MLLTAWETDGQRELNRRRIARMLVFHRTALLGNLTLTLTSTSKSSTPQQTLSVPLKRHAIGGDLQVRAFVAGV